MGVRGVSPRCRLRIRGLGVRLMLRARRGPAHLVTKRNEQRGDVLAVAVDLGEGRARALGREPTPRRPSGSSVLASPMTGGPGGYPPGVTDGRDPPRMTPRGRELDRDLVRRRVGPADEPAGRGILDLDVVDRPPPHIIVTTKKRARPEQAPQRSIVERGDRFSEGSGQARRSHGAELGSGRVLDEGRRIGVACAVTRAPANAEPLAPSGANPPGHG